VFSSAGLKKALRVGAFLRPWLRNLYIPASLLCPRLCKQYLAVPLVLLSLLSTAAGAATQATAVRYVIDGDTVVLADGQHLRLLGINAPELGKDGAPDQPLAAQARERLTALVEHRRVVLVYERERQDHYGRQLAHVLLPDGEDAEQILLREGLAWAVAVPPDVGSISAYLAAEKQARDAHRGVWGEVAYAPTPANRLTANDTGFRFIEGTVLRSVRHRNVIYFDLAPQVALVVDSADWKKYYRGKPSALVGRRVVARGWLTEYRGRLHMRVPHPAMLTWSDSTDARSVLHPDRPTP
jgi:endonuclease YncB( thermonuclease family)